MPLPRVKLAGRSDVTVVWASALPAEKANVEMKTATSEAAKRCDDIMTYLARIPQKRLGLLQQELAQMLEVTPTKSCRRHRTPPLASAMVTKARDELNYSPYLPAAGLYSLFSDSFGPVP